MSKEDTRDIFQKVDEDNAGPKLQSDLSSQYENFGVSTGSKTAGNNEVHSSNSKNIPNTPDISETSKIIIYLKDSSIHILFLSVYNK